MSALLLTAALALAEPGVERVEPWTHDDVVAHLESEKQQLREEIALLKKELRLADYKIKFLAAHAERLHKEGLALTATLEKAIDALEKKEAEAERWKKLAEKLLDK